MDRAKWFNGASCAMCAFGRAICAARASGAGGRVSRNEQVVGSIPTGGSLSCSSAMFIDLNFDGSPISVERFVERVVWSGRPDARVSWLRSVVDGGHGGADLLAAVHACRPSSRISRATVHGRPVCPAGAAPASKSLGDELLPPFPGPRASSSTRVARHPPHLADGAGQGRAGLGVVDDQQHRAAIAADGIESMVLRTAACAGPGSTPGRRQLPESAAARGARPARALRR